MKKIMNKLLTIPASVVLAAPIVSLASCKDNTQFFTVSFDTNGGAVVEKQLISRGHKVVKPADPVRGSYIFAGWYTDKEFKFKYDFDSTVYENLMLYAKWDVFNGKVTKDIWNEAVNFVTTISPERNFMMTCERKFEHNTLINEDIYDGYYESSATPGQEHTIADQILPGYTWGYSYKLGNNPKRSFKQSIESVSDDPAYPCGQALQIIKLLKNNQKYSFDSGNWVFDESTESYYGRILHSIQLFNAKIKFNENHRIRNFELWSGTGGAQLTYTAVFNYDKQKIDVPTNYTDDVAWIHYNNSKAPEGIAFDEQETKTVPFSTQKISAKVKSTAQASTQFKVIVSTTDLEPQYKKDPLFSETITLNPGETKTVEFDFAKCEAPFWKDVKFVAQSRYLYIIPME